MLEAIRGHHFQLGLQQELTEVIVEAESGLMSITGHPDGVPVRFGVAMVDLATGLSLVNGVLAALLDTFARNLRLAAVAVVAHPALWGTGLRQAARRMFDPVDRSLADEVNARLRRALLRAGAALIGRTVVDKATCLKLTLLNPNAREADLVALLALVREAGSAAERLVKGAA